MRKSYVLALVVVLVIGGGVAAYYGYYQIPGVGKDVIQLDQVPDNVMQVAKEQLPDVTFDKAWRKKNGEYEVSGKDKKGKIREIDIKPDGTITEIE
jgi:hypothetical protein